MFSAASRKILILFCFGALVACAAGCVELNELKKPQPSTYYAASKPLQTNELRWANGATPKTFDPAFANAPAEMQVVRAAFEGLTEWDAKTLNAVPGIAERWEASEDRRTWTFYLRRGAVWSNNRKIVATDFVRSWRRLRDFGDQSPHQTLLGNIVGAAQLIKENEIKPQAQVSANQNQTENQQSTNVDQTLVQTAEENSPANSDLSEASQPQKEIEETADSNNWFGVEALDDATLRVYLIEPDADFPKLAAHSSLRPVFGDGAEFAKTEHAAKIVTSGAFKFVGAEKSQAEKNQAEKNQAEKNQVVLERSRTYWNAEAVKLERVRFVDVKTAEAALAAYRAGEVDAVTNVAFEPLAFKLLASYRDFKRSLFNAVSFYEFNSAQPPFDDKRVRKALTVAIDRERLVNDELDGASFAAAGFLPGSNVAAVNFDPAEARRLLGEAGFADGKDFPKFKLLINRNDAQRRFARAVAAQWRKHLNVEAEIVMSSLEELNDPNAVKDFALVRRTTVLPTTAAAINLKVIFGTRQQSTTLQIPANEISAESKAAQTTVAESAAAESRIVSASASPSPAPNAENEFSALQNDVAAPPNSDAAPAAAKTETRAAAADSFGEFQNPNPARFLDEAAALEELLAIPLYFPSSYALVKPYVRNFEPNLLDAPLLREIEIEADWQVE